ncbi:putative S-layer protein [Candidatus Pacearchaeota archaeon]|jgi:hypothetical protein|nr:putative S-layer protein [Candidatus Pacearchaeota archaeon]
MTNKILSLLSLGIFALLVLTSFASALDISYTSNLPQANGTFALTIASATSGATIHSTTSSVTDSEGNVLSGIVFTIANVNLSGTSGSQTVIYNISGADFEFEEEYKVTITATETATPANNDSVTLTFNENTNWYDGENKGELEVSEMELDVSDGFGEEDNYWYPFDETEITFNVENNGDYDIENIQIEVCVWDETKGKCVFDEEDMKIDTDDFDLDSGDDQDVKIAFTVDAENLKAGDTEYTIYVKATGELTGDDAEDDNVDGDETGDSESQDIEIYTDDDFVIIDNIQFNSESASCGDTIELTADVWNVGESDLDDDEVYVKVYSKELGIDKVFEFDSGINAMESETITLSISLEDVSEKNYLIQLTAYSDEDMDDEDIFVTRHDEDEATFYTELKVEGSCSGTSSTPTAAVSATLDSEAKAGQELIVKATIVNTGSETKTFTLSASGYASWASSATLDKNSVTLNAGASQEVSITLEVLEDVSGENGFDIEVVEGNKFLSQPVTVTIEEASLLPSLTGFTSGFGDNAYLYGIGALNILLVAAIIFVAVKVARRKKQE